MPILQWVLLNVKLYLLTLVYLCETSKLPSPELKSAKVSNDNTYLQEGKLVTKLLVEVQGVNLYKGLEIKLTRSDTDCQNDIDHTVQESWTMPTAAEFIFVIPVSDVSKLYLCVRRTDLNYPDSEVSEWHHAGKHVFIRTDPKKSASAYSDHGDHYKTRTRRQVETTNDIRVAGLRVETADRDPQYSENGVPALLVDSDATLRLFGIGLSADLLITFTKEPGQYGSDCEYPATSSFQVLEDGLGGRGVTALVKVRLPNSPDKNPFYVCIKKKVNSTLNRFVHQGSETWLRIDSYSKLLPLWASLLIIVMCLSFSALFSGLNLGLMSIDRTELKILINTGNELERKYARTIKPVRDHGNYLLCSILLGNVLVNSTFTILLDDLTSGLVAVICSTLAIVIFGEISPQAICSRHGLEVGARTILITKMIMVVTFPLSYPVSRILDLILGEEIGNVYNRERLKELVKVTTDTNDLDRDEVNIISGALELRKKTVSDVMTRIEDVFMLDYEATLDFETVSEIMKSGFSRVPVYERSRNNIVTVLYIKDLAFVDPDDNTPLKTLCEFYRNPCNFVFEDVKLDVMFRQFKEGNKGHMAFVHRVNSEGEGDPFYETIGLITLEDVIEELIQAEIMDETDVFTDNRSKRRRIAERTKQDFSMFAERRDNQSTYISPQLTLATYQYLSTTVELFKPDLVSETILRRMFKQDIFINLKRNKEQRRTDSAGTHVIYERGKPADYFSLILEGRVEVTVGSENLVFESGPFTYFGLQALTQTAEAPFEPEYDVKVLTDVLYMRIRRQLYMAARRATLMEHSRDVERGSTDNVGSEEDAEVEKLLHSLGMDERSPAAPASPTEPVNGEVKFAPSAAQEDDRDLDDEELSVSLLRRP